MTLDLPSKLVSRNKLLGLEIIRFVSALAVLFWHYQHFSYVADKPIDFVRELQPLWWLLKPLYSRGYLGVQIFWCISGYIFFWKYGEVISRKLISANRFFVLRFSRLYPLHFFTLLLVAFFQFMYVKLNGYYFVYQNNDISHFVHQLFMASNWGFQVGDSFNGPIWSISIEVLVYFIFFAILRCFGNSILINVFVVSVFVVTLYIGYKSQLLMCLGYFYVGGLSAFLKKWIDSLEQKRLFNIFMWFLVFCIPLVAWGGNSVRDGDFLTLFLLLYTPVVLYCFSFSFDVSPRIQNIVEIAGNMTYSSYLIHFPLQLIVVLFFSALNLMVPLYSPLFFLGFMATVLGISFLLYRFFEMPAQNLIRAKFG